MSDTTENLPTAEPPKEAAERSTRYSAQVHFNFPVNMPSVYATNMLIQSSDEEVVISFFEAQPPFFTDNSEEAIRLAEKVGVRADCVARITVSHKKFEIFTGLFADFLEQMHEAKERNG